MKTQILQIFLLIPFLTFGQSQEGYWDNQRITNKEIKLGAGEKIVVKSEDFPVGTTEFAYRITLLDENQKMVSDLASVLKAIPDPYYIGKGAGSAISLLSSISGSDKCTYAVFSDNVKASDFVGSENIEKACLYQKNPVSKDAKVISLSKNTCLDDEAVSVWFAFKNENWVMSEKIVLEIVPWVNNIASRGWSKKNKEILQSTIYNVGVNSKIKKQKRDEVVIKIVELVSKEYRFEDFQKLSSQEQKLIIEKNEENAFAEVGLKNNYAEIYCYFASNLAKEGKIDEGIELLNNKVISNSSASAVSYNSLAELYIQSNQFQKALKTLQTAEKLDTSELKVQMNLAHVYMFLDEITKSKDIHKKYKSQNISAKQSWKNKAINDLDTFKKSKLPQNNIDKIWRLYN